MPQASQTVQNNFKEGLKTEFTGLNFPENAATAAENCVFEYIGDISRRGGINYEANFQQNIIDSINPAMSNFKWLNAGGDGSSQILVQQIGNILYFYLSSAATTVAPLSTTLLSSTVNITPFQAQGNTTNTSQTECQYSSGNGYLFVFHPACDPFYCTYVNGAISATVIKLQTRDYTGILEPGVADNFRPLTLTAEHQYNLLNQGWSLGSGWNGNSSYNGQVPLNNLGGVSPTVTLTLTSSAGTLPAGGSSIQAIFTQVAGTGPNAAGDPNGQTTLVGTVNSTTSTTITITFISNSTPNLNQTGFWSGGNFFAGPSPVQLSLINVGFINTWFSAVANYPSNADIWWLYKDTTLKFNPTLLFQQVQQQVTPAPKGAFVVNPFNIDRSSASGIQGLTTVVTTQRPLTGAFYQGRLFYAGVNSSQQAAGDEAFYTWTENIYFSQIIQNTSSFSKCYQQNDPTNQNLFEIVSSDGGQIVIPGCGAIYKLFPLRFGLLVFAANGIWFIGGSTGIGFSASDYTVTKISSIRAIAGTSFIDVQGYPMFWNQEGIYYVTPSAQGGSAHSPDIQLDVQNLTLGTILTFYDDIPLSSKYFARGDYDELNYIVQWLYISTGDTGIHTRYNYDSVICYNIITKAFYPYTLPTTSRSAVSDVKYILSPGGSSAPSPIFKYICHDANPLVASFVTFAEENDFTNFVDFISENGTGFNYISTFTTGYNLPGQALRKMQIPYIYMFSRNPFGSQCGLQAIWDYASNTASGKESTVQIITMSPNNLYRKVRLRGRGIAIQIKVSSVQGKPFDLMGWSVLDQINQVV